MNYSVAILIISHKAALSDYEKHSLIQCQKILGHYPIFYICPKGLDVREYPVISPSVSFDFIPAYWQKTYTRFRKLKTRPFLYDRFKEYDYILFYEPDAFVFRDELSYWMSAGYDHIGAPWQKGTTHATPDAPLIGVGNGGFCLRRVAACRKALRSFGYLKRPRTMFLKWLDLPWWRKILRIPGLLLDLTLRNNTYYLLSHYRLSEDRFWGEYVSGAHAWFQVPDAWKALQFSFETNPSVMYALNNNNLPFGCHAWWRYDLDFWRPFIQPPE